MAAAAEMAAPETAAESTAVRYAKPVMEPSTAETVVIKVSFMDRIHHARNPTSRGCSTRSSGSHRNRNTLGSPRNQLGQSSRRALLQAGSGFVSSLRCAGGNLNVWGRSGGSCANRRSDRRTCIGDAGRRPFGQVKSIGLRQKGHSEWPALVGQIVKSYPFVGL
jgi:hypothetical protein